MDLSGIPMPQMDWDSANLYASWKKFQQHCELIFGGPLKGQQQDVKVTYLLLWIGDRGGELFNSWGIESGEAKKLQSICERFSQHFQPKSNTIFSRFVFNNEIQANHSIDTFVTKLRLLAKDCQFHDPEEMIRDRIVFGITDKRLQERLISEGGALTFDKAVQICQSYERTAMQMKHLTSSPADEHECHLVNKRKSPPRNDRKSQPKHTYKHTQPSATREPSGNTCRKCGYKHSQSHKCLAEGKRCNACNKWNHFEKMCKSKNSASTIQFGINSVKSRIWTYNNQAFANMEVSKTSVQFKLDTGAQVNILPMHILKTLTKHATLTKSPGNLHAYNGSKLDVKGYCTLPCQYGSKTLETDFYIVKTRSSPILGLKSCTDFGLVKIVYALDNGRFDSSRSKPLTKEVLLTDCADLFNGIGEAPGECEIKIDPNYPPVIHPPRKVPVALRDRLKAELKRMEEHGVIAKVTTPTKWVNSMVIVEKTSGNLRVCLDPKDLNKAIIRPHYPMRTLEDVLPQLSGAKFFTKLDARSGYWTIKLSEKSSYLTTFNTPFGRHRFRRLPFGLNSSQDEFQRMIDECYEGLPGIVCIVGDILVYGRTREEHDKHLRDVLARTVEKGIKFNTEKLTVAATEVKYFGHVLTSDGLRPDPSKLKITAICDMDQPRNRAELETLLGMVNYLSKFAPNLADITSPLRALLVKNVEFIWDDPQTEAFNKVKQTLTTSPVLSYYDVNKPLTLQVDASKFGLGATLLQEHKPIAYASKSLTASEINYAQIEKEMFAILFGCRRFHQYVYGQKVNVQTDHLPLVSIMKKPLYLAPPRLQRMLLSLQPYDLDVKHIPGKDIPVADTLSRKPITDTFPELSYDMDLHVHTVLSSLPVSDNKMVELRSHTNTDSQFHCLLDTIQNGWPNL